MLYCLIYNLNSSSGKKSKFINRVLFKLKKKNSVDYFETKTINQAREIFRDFNQKNYDRLIVAGGDGSVSFAINELIKNFWGIMFFINNLLLIVSYLSKTI